MEVRRPERARFRVKLKTEQISNNLYSPRGFVHGSENPLDVLEFTCKDNPTRGGGGGVQFTAKNTALVIDEVVDLADGHVLNDLEIAMLKNGTYGN